MNLRIRGCEVDIGIVYSTEKNKSGQLAQTGREIDFIAVRVSKRTYIQSACALETEEKTIDAYFADFADLDAERQQ